MTINQNLNEMDLNSMYFDKINQEVQIYIGDMNSYPSLIFWTVGTLYSTHTEKNERYQNKCLRHVRGAVSLPPTSVVEVTESVPSVRLAAP